MKNSVMLIVCLLMVYFCDIGINKMVAQNETTTDKTIRIVTTPDLYKLSDNWANHFMAANPGVKIGVINFTNADSENILNSKANLYFVSNAYSNMLKTKNLWSLKLSQDFLIPIINADNPLLSVLKNQEINTKTLKEVLINSEKRTWPFISKKGEVVPLNYYVVNNASEKALIGKYLSTKKEIAGTELSNHQELISAVKNDKYAIGFCKRSSLQNLDFEENILIMPMDRNRNKHIENSENVYTNLEDFVSKAWVGVFPKELTMDVQALASELPKDKNQLAFLKYISTEGQMVANYMGYAALYKMEKKSNLDKLGFVKQAETSNTTSFSFSVLFILSAIVFLLIFIALLLVMPVKKKLLQV